MNKIKNNNKGCDTTLYETYLEVGKLMVIVLTYEFYLPTNSLVDVNFI